MKVYIVFPYYGDGVYGSPSCVYKKLSELKADWPTAVDHDSDDDQVVGGFSYMEMEVN